MPTQYRRRYRKSTRTQSRRKTSNYSRSAVATRYYRQIKPYYKLGRMTSGKDGYNLITRTTVIGDRGSNAGGGQFFGVFSNAGLGYSPSLGTALTNQGTPSMQMQFSLSKTLWWFGGANPTYTADLPNYTEITNMYDQYRIKYVELTFLYNSNSFSSPGAITYTSPNFWICKDYDDSGNALLSDIVQYNNVVMWSPAKSPKFVIKIRPKPSNMVYGASATTGYGPVTGKQWISTTQTASQQTVHYGIKMVADVPVPQGTSTDVLGYFSIFVKYHIEVKNTK